MPGAHLDEIFWFFLRWSTPAAPKGGGWAHRTNPDARAERATNNRRFTVPDRGCSGSTVGDLETPPLASFSITETIN
jgi:hypothetical protein